jgi:hypothetical protein
VPEQFVVPTIIVGLVVLVAFVLMIVGWRGRVRRQSGLALAPVPTELAPASYAAEVLYVATTRSDAQLERIVAGGLGLRSRADVSVHPEGVLLALRGSDPILIPAEAVADAGFGTYTIDRVVERDGLAVITWRLGDTLVDTWIRANSDGDKEALVSAVSTLASGSLA